MHEIVYRNILKYMYGGVLVIDLEGSVVTMNAAAERILELSQDDIRARPFAELFLDDRRNDDFCQAVLDAIYDRDKAHSGQVAYARGDHVRELRITTSFLMEEAGGLPVRKVGVIVVFTDVTDLCRAQAALAEANRDLEARVARRTAELSAANRKLGREVLERRRAHQQLAELALLDQLTGLGNRRQFETELAKAGGRAARGEAGWVMYCDLDGFKPVNDVHGHAFGDWVLARTARRLEACVRVEDTLARIGGDEFAVLMTGNGGREAAEQVAGRVVTELARPFEADEGRIVRIGVSIGIAPLGGDVEAACAAADAALYAVKRAGKGGFRFADPQAA